MDEEILNALKKRAKGYSYNEVQEEFAVRDDGEVALVKRKVLEKYCPPDSSALKAYLELTPADDISGMSDEELEKEKLRLLKELKNYEENRAKDKNTKRKKEI